MTPGLRRLLALALAVAATLGRFSSSAPLPAARAADDAAAAGKDTVLLVDGRVLRCTVGNEADGRLELGFPAGSVRVPKEEIVEIRRYADIDSTPRNEEEKQKAAAGLVRWGAEWINPVRREDNLRKARERERKLWEENGAHNYWENRWKRNTAHFTIEADLPRKVVDMYEATLEGFYEYFTSALKVSPKRRIPVFIFRTREEFRAFQLKDTGQLSESTVGYFVPIVGSEHLVLFDLQGDRAETLNTLFHETTHLLIYLANPAVELPTAVNEGLAEYYGASLVVKGKVVRGRIQDDRLLDLQDMVSENRLLPIHTLFAHGHPDGAGAPGDDEFSVDDYAEGWAFVHFLFHAADGKYLPRLLAYLNAHWALKIADAAPGSRKERLWMKFAEDQALLLRMLKVKDFAALDAEFQAYVATLPLQGAAAMAERGFHILVHAKDPVRAEAAFREAMAKAPDDIEVLSRCVRGLSLLGGREKEAEELLQRTMDLDPLNTSLRYELSGWFPAGDVEIPHLHLAADMDPGDPVGMASRAWLAIRKVDRDHYLHASPFSGEESDRATEALRAAGYAPPAECLRVAQLLLDAGDAAGALVPAQRAAQGAAADPAGFEAWARAAAALGEPAEFKSALLGCRAALEARAKASGGASPAVIEDQLARALVESIGYALALEKPAEARRACEAWYARKDCTPRLEAEWLLYAGLPLLTGDFRAFQTRYPMAASAVPGSSRINFLPLYMKDPEGKKDGE